MNLELLLSVVLRGAYELLVLVLGIWYDKCVIYYYYYYDADDLGILFLGRGTYYA